MKKIKKIKIQIDEQTEKTFVINELTLEQLLTLAQINPIFGGDSGDEKESNNSDTENKKPKTAKPVPGVFDELKDFIGSGQEVMKMSCDFDMKAIMPLAPSDISLLLEGFKEVNQTFLAMLEKLGILEAVKAIINKAFSDFSKTLVF